MSLHVRPAVRLPDPEDIECQHGSAPRRRDPSLALAIELPVVCRFAGYEVLGRIAVGGMAEVFLARERGEGGSSRHVALKVIRAHLASSPQLAELFLQEGRVALGLGHPNICHTLRFGTENGRPFLAMELVHGVTLRELFTRTRRQGRPLTDAMVVRIVANVAEALHSAHVAKDARGRALGIVHQDVSPQNVMVAYDGTVKLLDFGVASTSTERDAPTLESSQVMVRGKAAYLSPEQCHGQAVDARSDVFSLGIVLYEMLTGSRLFTRPTSVDTMHAIACDPLPAWPASVPVALRRVLERALARDEADRYPSAEAMQDDLEGFLVAGGHVVTSRTIARELEAVLGADYGRAPAVDPSSEAIAWLRSEAETQVQPVLLVKQRAGRRPAPKTLLFVAAAIVAGVVVAGLALRGTEPEARTSGVTTSSAAVPEPTSVATSPVTVATAPLPVVPEAAPAPAPAPSVEPAPSVPSHRTRHARARRAPGDVIRDLDF